MCQMDFKSTITQEFVKLATFEVLQTKRHCNTFIILNAVMTGLNRKKDQ